MEWLSGLNILRLFAIVLILIYHLAPGVMPGGFLAVEIFFCISGFLFIRKIIREYLKSERVDVLCLIFGRLRRLFLPLLLCVMTTLAVGFFVDKDILTGGVRNTLAALTFTTNISELANGGSYEGAFLPNVFEHTWFLAVLMQSYIIVALISKLILTGARNPRRSLAGLGILFAVLSGASVAISAINALNFGAFDRAYFATDSHIFAFLLGGAYAVFRELHPRAARTRKSGYRLALLLTLAIVIALSRKAHYSEWQTFVIAQPVVALAAVIMLDAVVNLQRNLGAPHKTNPITSLLDWLGAFSFGVYLYHWPLKILIGQFIAADTSVALKNTIIVAVSFAMAWLSMVALRAPRMSRRRTAIPAVRLVKVAMLFVMAVLSILTLRATPEKSSIMADLSENYIEIARDYSEEDYLAYEENLTATLENKLSERIAILEERRSEEALAVALSQTEVLMIGDSVMLGAKEELESRLPNAIVDAKESRGIEAASGIIAQYASKGRLPHLIVVALATNERTMTDELLGGILDAAGSGHDFIFVTGYAGPEQPRETQNSDILAFASRHENVYVADWWSIGSADWSLMYADHIHLNGEGRVIYANLICDTAIEYGVLK